MNFYGAKEYLHNVTAKYKGGTKLCKLNDNLKLLSPYTLTQPHSQVTHVPKMKIITYNNHFHRNYLNNRANRHTSSPLGCICLLFYTETHFRRNLRPVDLVCRCYRGKKMILISDRMKIMEKLVHIGYN